MNHPEASNDYERNLLANVAKFGWQGTHVAAKESAASFTYSIGFYETYGKAELLILGLSGEVAHSILSAAAKLFEEQRLVAVETPVEGLLRGYPCFLIPIGVPAKSEYMLSANWYYKEEQFPACQVVWPTEEGYFPWDPNAPSGFAEEQPLLSAWRPSAQPGAEDGLPGSSSL